MADVIIENTQLGATKAVLIAKMVQKELAFNAVLMKTVTDVSQFAIDGLKQISFPKLSSFTVANRTEGTAGSASAITATVDTMDLNFNAYVAWIVDAMTKKQSNINAELEIAKWASQAQARYVDEQIITKLASVASSFENVGAEVDVTYANLLAMKKKILKADGIIQNTCIIASPHQESVLFSLDEFKRADVYGQANIPSGVVGSILGMPVIVHNGLADKQLFMYEKSAIAVGFQKNASYGSQPAIEYGVGAERSAIDQLFGIVGLQLGLKGAGATKSPLVLGLND
jgi:hypothetical protein